MKIRDAEFPSVIELDNQGVESNNDNQNEKLVNSQPGEQPIEKIH